MAVQIESSANGVNIIFPFGEIRHDWADPYDYWGIAIAGSDEADSVWRITRIAVSIGGVTTTTVALDVAWDDRATETYA